MKYYYMTYYMKESLFARVGMMHPLEWMATENKSFANHYKDFNLKPTIIINSWFEIDRDQYEMLEAVL